MWKNIDDTTADHGDKMKGWKKGQKNLVESVSAAFAQL